MCNPLFEDDETDFQRLEGLLFSPFLMGGGADRVDEEEHVGFPTEIGGACDGCTPVDEEASKAGKTASLQDGEPRLIVDYEALQHGCTVDSTAGGTADHQHGGHRLTVEYQARQHGCTADSTAGGTANNQHGEHPERGDGAVMGEAICQHSTTNH
eukprot:gene531-1943_t